MSLYEKLVMFFLVRRYKKLIQNNPDNPEVLEMAQRTGTVRKLNKFKELK